MGLVGNTAWAVAPVVSTYFPADNQTGIFLPSTLQLTFNQAVTAVTGKNIVIKKTTDNSTVESIAADNTTKVVVSGSKVYVNPATTLATSTDYYVEIDAGAFKNSVNEDYVGIADTTTWNFTTAAGVTVSSYLPSNGATAFKENANLRLTFTEPVTATSGKNIRIYKSDGSVVESIAANNTAKVSISSGTVTINPTANLMAGNYYVQIDAGAFTGNTSGASYAGITDTATWAFTTAADTTAPTLSSLSPADNATGVAVGSNLTVFFDENVTAVSGKDIRIYTSGGTLAETIAANNTAKVSVSSNKVTVNPANDLAFGAGYYVQIDAGAFVDTATTPNAYAGISDTTSWNFTTLSGAAVSVYSPTNGATTFAENADLALIFSESVTAVPGKNIRIYKADGSLVETIAVANTSNVTLSGIGVTIKHTNLTAGTYYIQIDAGAFTGNVTGASYAGITNTTTWAFTTVADTTAPTLSSVSPADNATGVAVGSNLTLNFSEKVTAATGKTIRIYQSGGTLLETIAANDAAKVTVSGSRVTINPAANLALNTGYHVQIDSGAFVDTATSANPYAGISTTSTWNFTTTAGAAATSYVPANGATNFSETGTLYLYLSESVNAVAGKYIRIYKADGTLVETLSVTNNVSTYGATVTVKPSACLPSGSYYVQIDAGAFTGVTSGSSYAGIANATTWAFSTVADTTAPTISSTNPSANVTSIGVSNDLSVTFSERVSAVGGKNIKIYKSDGTLAESLAADDTTKVSFSGSKVWLKPSRDLDYSTNYYVTIDAGAFVDRATTPNPYAGLSSPTAWKFTTMANPSSTSSNPAPTTTTSTSSTASPNTSVAAGATATLGNSTTSVDAGAGSTLNITQGSSGATINLPPTPEAVNILIGGNKLAVKPTESGSVIKTATVTQSGRDTTVLNVTAGTAQLSASAPNQPLVALGSGANAVLVSAKGTSTTVIANVDRGSGVTSLTLPKPATGKDADAAIKLTIAGQDVNVKPQGSRDVVVTLKTVQINGQDVQVVAVSSGFVTVTATQPNQPLLAIGSGSNAVVVTSTGSSSEAASQVDSASGTTTIGVTSGAITLPANAFAAAGNGFAALTDGKLYAGEVAVLNSSGKVTSVRLGSLTGDSGKTGDPLAVSASGGFFITTTIPNLSGKVARLADLQDFTASLANAWGEGYFSIGQGADGVLGLTYPGGKLYVLPVGDISVDTSRADGITVTGNGRREVVRSGVVTRFVPVVSDRAQLLADAFAIDRKATVILNNEGVMAVNVNGVTYAMKPGWMVENGDGIPGVSTDIKGRLIFQDDAGNQQTLYPAFADLAQLVAIFRSYDANLTATGNDDGSVTARFQGKSYTLLPEYALTAVPAEHVRDSWWTEADDRMYIKSADGKTAQAFTVK